MARDHPHARIGYRYYYFLYPPPVGKRSGAARLRAAGGEGNGVPVAVEIWSMVCGSIVGDSYESARGHAMRRSGDYVAGREEARMEGAAAAPFAGLCAGPQSGTAQD